MTASVWHCPSCKEPLGRITKSGELIVTASGAIVERTRTAAMVHCRCGRALAFNGRRVIFNSTVLGIVRQPQKEQKQ